MPDRSTSHRSGPLTAAAAHAPNVVRAWWLCRMNNATQVLFGSVASMEPGAIQRALRAFERRCPPPGTIAERLVFRGAVLEIYLRLETALNDWTTSMERAAARQQLYGAALPAAVDGFLLAARSLAAAAERVRTRPLHERVRSWIDEHPDDTRSIGAIATLAGAHPRTLNRHFARHVGKTVQEYRWDRRAACARQLMAMSALKVDAVASAVGAASRATVYRLLHKRTPDAAAEKTR